MTPDHDLSAQPRRQPWGHFRAKRRHG